MLRTTILYTTQRLFLVVVTCCLLLPQAVNAANTLNRPLFIIDGKMHAEEVTAIGSDQSNRFLASVSTDKTLRIWQLPFGSLLSTLRIPVASGAVGELYSVAVSSGGRIIAVAGNTSDIEDKESGYVIYLFDVATGKMQRQIAGLPEKVRHIAISADGQYLAAVMDARGGLRVYRIVDGFMLRSDDRYGDTGTWADFDNQGRLVTASQDGYIRLYNQQFVLLHKRKVSANYAPYSVVFAPDGNKIAVGFKDHAVVAVFSVETLDVLYFPDVSAAVGDFRTVAWSEDGKFLFGAGSYRNRRKYLIRIWKNAGKTGLSGLGEYLDIPVSDSMLSHIIPLQKGGLLFAGAGPVLGGMDAAGVLTFRRTRPTASFATWQHNLKVSTDGSVVSFPYDSSGSELGIFSARELRLLTAKSAPGSLQPPLTRSNIFNLSGWSRQFGELKLNGKLLNANIQERINSVAINRNSSYFVVGSTSHLRLFDQSGHAIWSIPVSSAIEGVNISLNGRVIIAVHADGTLRWYQLASGRHALSLYPHRDKKRWVIWTPDNFFAASADGDQLVGWHINQGPEKPAKFIPMQAVRKTNFKPELIKGLFGG